MRNGKIVGEDPWFVVDRNRGFYRIPVYAGTTHTPVEVRNLKFTNREAWGDNLMELRVGHEVVRIQKDELRKVMEWV